MSVEITEDGAVVAAGQPVDYATVYDWAVDYPEKITDLVEDTRAFVTVLADAEAAPLEEQQAAMREAFTAGRPKRPGAFWSA
jgi:hypothetical protein